MRPIKSLLGALVYLHQLYRDLGIETAWNVHRFWNRFPGIRQIIQY